MVPVYFRESRHDIVDLPQARYLRDHFDDKNLFIYLHHDTGNFLVAYWVDRGKKLMLELACLGKTPELTKGVVETIESMKRGTPGCEKNKKATLEHLKGLENFYRRMEEDEQAEFVDAWEFLERKQERRTKHVVAPG